MDLQHDFLGAEGSRMPVLPESVAAVIGAANAILGKRALAPALPILVVNQFPVTDRILNFFRKGAAVAGTRGADLDPRIMNAGTARVIAKASPSAFTNPELDLYLRAEGITDLYVMGVFAEGCVRSTVLDARRRGYGVSVIADAVASNALWKKRFALWAMKRAGAAIMQSVHAQAAGVHMPATILTVASVQLACELGAMDGNLQRATNLVEQAASRGARLVLLPELMSGGYTLTEKIWDTAEPFDGTSTRWMRSLSLRLGIYLGTTFLEAEGEHFYNTFVLAGPDGRIAGRVRKNPPASFEAYFFTAGKDPHWFDTAIGRIGVGICFENALYERYCDLHDARIDLYLRPFSGASFEAKFPVRQHDADVLNAALRDGTAEAARLMGIPVIMSNKVGRLVTTLPAGFPPQDIEFPGFSAIADSDGTLIGQLGPGQEGVVIGTVKLDPARKTKSRLARQFGRWTAKMPWWAFIWILTQRMGERSYARNFARRSKALAVSKISALSEAPPAGAKRKR